MPIRPDSPAPYGPPAAILELISSYRDRGLTTPFSADVMIRAGVSESLVPRVMKSMEGLDLIDGGGNPTPALEGLRRASTEDFKARLGDVIKSAYAEVFQFTDPAVDDLTRVADAFRAYEPAGQRTRMVTLFMGMCEAAGIVSTAKPTGGAPARISPLTRKKPLRIVDPAKTFDHHSPTPTYGSVPPALQGLIVNLPSAETGWTEAQRDRWLKAIAATVDFAIPVRATDGIESAKAHSVDLDRSKDRL